jgi:hypothetical protein
LALALALGASLGVGVGVTQVLVPSVAVACTVEKSPGAFPWWSSWSARAWVEEGLALRLPPAQLREGRGEAVGRGGGEAVGSALALALGEAVGLTEPRLAEEVTEGVEVPVALGLTRAGALGEFEGLNDRLAHVCVALDVVEKEEMGVKEALVCVSVTGAQPEADSATVGEREANR